MTIALDDLGRHGIGQQPEALEDLDDVQNVYANFDISEDILKNLTAA